MPDKSKRTWVMAERKVLLPVPLFAEGSDIPDELLLTFGEAKELSVQYLVNLASSIEALEEEHVGIRLKNNIAMLGNITKDE
jgi:hypothetical protein